MLSLDVATENWPLKAPFRITGYTFTDCEVTVVTLRRGARMGRGEAAGVYYHGEDAGALTHQIEGVRAAVEAGIGRAALRELLPPGGARNAIDSALWDLEAKETETPAWMLAGLAPPRALPTTCTVGAGTPDEMARAALGLASMRRLKLKLTGEDDAGRVRAIRAARPDAWIGVDANQGHTRASLEALIPTLADCGVALIEQPVKIGDEESLRGFNSPIPLAADESMQSLGDVARLKGLFTVANIKLDKCGGLTEALLMIAEARRHGMAPMVGCMEGTSLSVGPGFLAGQLCDYVDLDAPLFLSSDREPSIAYKDGFIMPPVVGWGLPDATSEKRRAMR